MSGPDLCPKCKGLHFKTDPCIIRKSSGGSSEVEHRPSKSGVEGSIPSRRSKKSTAARKVVPEGSGARKKASRANGGKVLPDPSAGTQALPVDTNNAGSPSQVRPVPHKDVIVGSNPTPATIPKPKHIDRHKPGWMAAYMRKYRAKLKAEREEK